MQKKINNISSIMNGILYGLLILLIGFGMMYIWWTQLGTSEGLKGLFDYRAATIGDAICLPVVLGALLAFEKYNSQVEIKRKYAYVCGMVFAVIGIIIQASWLLSDKTQLNWSIPIQHHFNIAGWYHALFFIAVFGLMAYHISNLCMILKNKSTPLTWFEKNLLLLFVSAGSLFILLFLQDDYGEKWPCEYMFSVAVMCLLIILLVFAKIAGGKDGYKDLTFVISIGLFSGYGIAMFLCM